MGLVALLHIPEFWQLFLARSPAQIIAGRYLNDLIYTAVVVNQLSNLVEAFEILVESPWIESKVDSRLSINPMGVEMFEFWKYFLHFVPEQVEVGV